jgi:hypothetical protein
MCEWEGGLYYQQYLDNNSNANYLPAPQRSVQPEPQQIELRDVITTADASQLRDSSADELLQEIQDKESKLRLYPLAVGGAIAFTGLLLIASVPMWIVVPATMFSIFGMIYAKRRDYEKKTVFLNYELDDHSRLEYVKLLGVVGEFAQASRLWRITSSEHNDNTKYHAGAGTSVVRKMARICLARPRFLETSVASYELSLGDQTLYFFPDRIFIYQSGAVGVVQYRDLLAESRRMNFVEDGGVPQDSRILNYTWRFTNKNGGPDRRFSNNTQIPVVEYGNVFFATKSGVRYVLQVSDPLKAEKFVQALKEYLVPPSAKDQAPALTNGGFA